MERRTEMVFDPFAPGGLNDFGGDAVPRDGATLHDVERGNLHRGMEHIEGRSAGPTRSRMIDRPVSSVAEALLPVDRQNHASLSGTPKGPDASGRDKIRGERVCQHCVHLYSGLSIFSLSARLPAASLNRILLREPICSILRTLNPI